MSEVPGSVDAAQPPTTITGVGVSPGRVIGPVRRMAEPVAAPAESEQRDPGRSADDEKARLAGAVDSVVAELGRRAEHAAPDAAAVLSTTAMMAADPTLTAQAGTLIDDGASAERAIWQAAGAIASQLEELGGYMAERVTDVLDVRSRTVAELRGLPAPGVPDSDTPYVLVAVDLAPADTATLRPDLVLALVTSDGGPQSHTAIIARAAGLPAVVAARGADALVDGTEVAVDGGTGTITAPPSEADRAGVVRWQQQQLAQQSFTGDATLSDGTPVELLANVGGGADATAAAEAGAAGVGLFRTEFSFLGSDHEPSVDEQYAQYRPVFDAFAGRKVVVRTLDAGADKPLPFVTDTDEPNPALGVRGFRTTLSSPEVLVHQLEAIARAAADSEAHVRVMAPMISTPAEAERFATVCREAGLETAGVMVEVPSAALSAPAILRRVDFLSIGTNDLTQYTMAADRQLGALSGLNDPWQHAVLRLVAETARAGAERPESVGGPAPVGVCGEAAADPALAVVLLGLGVTSLSMTARALPRVATVLRTVSADDCRRLAALALDSEDAEAARAAVRAELPVLEELGL
ncbi:phosphoenolpyruvate--protein phosphotransferase [Mycetocola reblochoni]|uniref:Phosphoenolpyruvate-protein phosphotransferase n=2 Tax=Mycetocola reblochoni TaxID=331618 RepID=A0A1R4J8N5_9MICO|nr:phosphoenolpyruvate--protein phosphotransferase [Mycetocola reblochoni]RLP70104.1 phosphoenolpyruvate--protein phosphotransferase [Mycetocola reblochoni]SJN28446.1 Phosphoenolpyruvate-protein phosphotransferase of PTS system [Mycetocola reblochoni REB411]